MRWLPSWDSLETHQHFYDALLTLFAKIVWLAKLNMMVEIFLGTVDVLEYVLLLQEMKFNENNEYSLMNNIFRWEFLENIRKMSPFEQFLYFMPPSTNINLLENETSNIPVQPGFWLTETLRNFGFIVNDQLFCPSLEIQLNFLFNLCVSA